MVELKAFADKLDGIRCYYRCLKGKEHGVGWCGNVILKKTKSPQHVASSSLAVNQNKVCTASHDFLTSTPFKGNTDSAVLDKKLKSLYFDVPSNAMNVNKCCKDNIKRLPVNSQCNVGKESRRYEIKPIEEIILTNTKINFKKDQEVETYNVGGTSQNSMARKTTGSEKPNPRETAISERPNPHQTASSDRPNPHVYHIPKNADIPSECLGDANQESNNDTTIEIVSSDDEEDTESTDRQERASQSKLVLNDSVNNISKHKQNSSQTQIQRTIDFPKIIPARENGAINLGIDYPPSLYANIQRAPPLFGGRMTENRLKEVGRVTKGAIEQLHKSLETCPGPNEEAEPPRGLAVSLMTHQKQALLWLLWRERQHPSGGILADDMGLGKTLTMISLVLKSKQEESSKQRVPSATNKLQLSRGTLVVCPASLVHEWYKEIERRVEKSQLRVCLYHGTNREKQVHRLANYDMVLTTYNLVSIEGKPHVESEKENKNGGLSEWLDSSQTKSKTAGPLFKISWRRIILDEGHSVKNHKTSMSIAVCSLESESRWIVTGTPIQNQTMDLYSLIKFLRLSPFDELKVWKREVDNKSNSGTKRMNSIVNSLLLRRTKDQTDKKTGKPLVSLPSRRSILHKLKLSEEEKSVYDLLQNFSKNMFTEFMQRNQQLNNSSACKSDSIPDRILGMNVEEALSTFGLLGVNAKNMGCLLVLILRLRQCCGHLSLMCEPVDTDLCKSEGIEIPLEEQFGNLSIDQSVADNHRKRAKQLSPDFISTKISSIISILKDFTDKTDVNGKPIKSVIVSQWTRMLDIVALHLRKNGFRIDFITGSVPAKKRSEIVEDFNTKKYPQIMLVSLKAGGVGLNLIGGSNLFLIDQHWNPALEDQACDRVYRVGQQNDVVIHRFLCEDTVEERIVQLQEKKKMLAQSVLYGGKSQKLSLNDLQVLFGLSS